MQFRITTDRRLYDAGRAQFAFDNFGISADSELDYELAEFYPTNTLRCTGFRTNERPRYIIRNHSCQNVRVPLEFDVSGPVNTTILDTTPNIAPGACYSYNLSSTLDLSAPGVYDFTGTITPAGNDTFPGNNSISLQRNTAINSLPYSEDFNTDDGNWYDNTRRCEQRFQWGSRCLI